MSRPDVMRRSLSGVFAAFGAAAVLAMPVANAQPEPSPEPTVEPAPAPAAAPAAPAGDCNAGTLAQTVSSVTSSLSGYFSAHPDANQALIDIARQPAFVAAGQLDGYFADHPQQADEVRAIQQPLVDYKNRCGLQVSPTDALTVLAEV